MRQVFADVRNIAGASGVLLAGRSVGAAAGFAFAVLLARTLPQHEVGIVFAAISSAFLASVLITLNVESGSIRFLVAARESGNAGIAEGFIYFGRLVLIYATPVVVGGYAALSFTKAGASANPALPLLAAASIPIIGWLRLSGAHATAMGRPAAGSLPRTALQPVALLILYPAFLLAGAKSTAELAIACFLGSFALAAIVQYALLRGIIRVGPSCERDFGGWRNWLANGFFMSAIILLQEYLQHAVVIVAALTLSPGDIAVLAISMRFISLIRFGVLSVNMASGPGISRAVARADHEERDRRLRAAAWLKAPAAALACLSVAVGAEPLLALIGPEYIGGGKALAWLTLIPLASAAFGPNQMLLNISGAQSWVFGVSLATIGLAVLAIPFAGATGGAAGAAMAAALIFAAWEAALHVVTKSRFGVDASFFAIAARRVRR